eukprot:6453877-Prymnesium_polylepis.1
MARGAEFVTIDTRRAYSCTVSLALHDASLFVCDDDGDRRAHGHGPDGTRYAVSWGCVSCRSGDLVLLASGR